MKKRKKNFLLIALVIILVAIAVGYAAFSSTLTISGTATASGTWDIHFASGSVSKKTDGTEYGTAIVDPKDNKTLNVNVELTYPGDGCEVTANIKNNGTIPAKLTGFKLTDNNGDTFSNDDIKIATPDMDTSGSEIIEAGKTCPFTFTIKWDKDSQKTEEITANFKITFTYEQATDEKVVNTNHGTHT